MKREITLMIYTNGYDDIVVDELKNFCKNENIIFKGKGFRGESIYDFTIEGNTVDYKKIVDKFEDRIRETYYATLGNILDLDNETFEKWKDIMDRFYLQATKENTLHYEFSELIKNINDISKLEYLNGCLLDDFCKGILNDRISMVLGQKNSWENHIYNMLEIDKMINLLKLAKENKYSLGENDIDSLIDILMKTMSKNC